VVKRAVWIHSGTVELRRREIRDRAIKEYSRGTPVAFAPYAGNKACIESSSLTVTMLIAGPGVCERREAARTCQERIEVFRACFSPALLTILKLGLRTSMQGWFFMPTTGLLNTL
jgi:hypothetical protein